MATGSGIKHATYEALSWGVAAIILISGVVFSDEIMSFIGLSANRESPQQNSVGVSPGAEGELKKTATVEASRRPKGELKKTAGGFSREVHLKATRNGQFYATAHINGRPINVVVDTGATLVSLSYKDAQKVGIYLSDRDFKYYARTANGITRSARVTLERVRIGNVLVRNVRASVSESGRLPITLLGMAFLGRLKELELRKGELVLIQ